MFAQDLNDGPAPVGRIVAVQSTGSQRAEQINARGGAFRAAIRGLEGGIPVDRVVEIRSIARAIPAREQWGALRELARSKTLRCIVSNTTEAGLALASEDTAPTAPTAPPVSYPAKLLALLAARHECGQGGVIVLPCELIEQNADRLRELVLEQAALWQLDADLVEWVRDACSWHNTLVDRIVAAPPAGDPVAKDDPLFAVAEPFASWIIEGDAANQPLAAHKAIEQVERLEPYHLRKVRILNGAHTALVAKALPRGIETVRQAAEDERIRPWLESLLFEEIVPAIADRVKDGESFARSVLERFANPFLEHRLADIALHHEKKLETRLRPTFGEFHAAFGRKPKILGEILGGA
jgi:tagaturonate reductase